MSIFRFFRSPFLSPLLFAGMHCAVPPAAAAADQHAAGQFDVSVIPAGASATENGTTTARMVIEKHYHGDLSGSGKGEMLSAVTGTPGSAAYVAIERVSGTLHGKQGSFVVQHNGSRKGGVNALSITIVPDSGTGELAGIGGTMGIEIVGGKHFYTVSYRLP